MFFDLAILANSKMNEDLLASKYDSIEKHCSIKFDIILEVYPDVTERDGDKRTYKNKLDVVVAKSGELKKNATIETYF